MTDERTNGSGAIVSAIISTDPDFRGRLEGILAPDSGIRVGLGVEDPFTSITDSHLQELQRLGPEVIFVDLESDPHVGLRFVQFLIDSAVARSVVAAGSADSPDLLLQAMQAGVQEFLPKPLDAEKVQGVVDRLRRKAGKAVTNGASGRLGQLLTVFSPKGGSGSTTFAVNLAVALHQVSRKRTLIVDLDMELGETALLLGMEPRFSSVDLVRNYHRVDEGLLASYIERDRSGVELLSAPYQPVDFQSVDGDRIGQILEFLKGHYDFIVIDAPKTLNPVTLNAFESSDRLFLLTTADLQSLRNVTRCLPLLQGLEGGRPDEWIRLVVNRHNPSLPITVGEVERTLGMKVYWTLRNDYRPIVRSINEGRPEVLDGTSSYAESLRKLAAEVAGLGGAPRPRAGVIGGLFAALRNGGGRG